MAQPRASRFFPPADTAGPEGLLAFGGQLSVSWLLDAYQHGIFPWPHADVDDPMLWWCPDPRAVFEWDDFHISRRLKRTIRNGRFHVTLDAAFDQVIFGCATANGRAGETWLTLRMVAAYQRLFDAGAAHSVEAWHDDILAGGVYGVAIGGAFAAESMFYEVTDGSKVALAYLIAHLRRRGYQLLDIQQLTPHTARLGATEIPRCEYLARLAEAVALPVTWGTRLEVAAAEVADQ